MSVSERVAAAVVLLIVSNVGPGSSRVISLLNPHFRLSCKLKSTDYFGSLVWDGLAPDEALLEELPRHTNFAPGDTVVTSGYSAVFPAGLPAVDHSQLGANAVAAALVDGDVVERPRNGVVDHMRDHKLKRPQAS